MKKFLYSLLKYSNDARSIRKGRGRRRAKRRIAGKIAGKVFRKIR